MRNFTRVHRGERVNKRKISKAFRESHKKLFTIIRCDCGKEERNEAIKPKTSRENFEAQAQKEVEKHIKHKKNHKN
jgi:hypothetical protein